MTRRDGEAGITLIEMLVALALFAMIGLVGFTTLDTILRAQARTDGRLDRLMQIDRALLVFARDAAQSVPRSLTLGEDGLTITRLPRRQVTFALSDNALVRRSGAEDDPLTQMLLDETDDVALRVLDGEGDWHDAWPVADVETAPIAVELALSLPGDRRVIRLATLPQAPPE